MEAARRAQPRTGPMEDDNDSEVVDEWHDSSDGAEDEEGNAKSGEKKVSEPMNIKG